MNCLILKKDAILPRNESIFAKILYFYILYYPRIK